MSNLTYNQKQEILDSFGSEVINYVRDLSLRISMDIATGKTINTIKLKQYQVLSNLNYEQKEAICDLLSETITDTIFRFLDMLEVNSENMRLLVFKDGVEYDLNEICEKMGGEITFADEDGWIQKYSKEGRFVL